VIKSGGIDLLDLIKEGLVQPDQIINIRNIPGLDQITYDQTNGLRLGANVTLADIESNSQIEDMYKALHQAVAHAGTPQIRNVASLGGNLAQRTRCWYFRSKHHECLRKGGNTCFARNGENELHAIMRNGSCASVHSSSVSTALLAFNAQVEISSASGDITSIPLAEFFITPGDDSSRENILESNELITAVILPPVTNQTRSYYIKQGARESHDWALADVAVVAEMSGNTCKSAFIALGAAAPIPILSKSAANVLINKSVNESTAKAAAEASMNRATPLSENAYKVPMFKAIVKRAVLNLA
jgi:xanthine dehydrogenase YagS FAD-binding subunit